MKALPHAAAALPAELRLTLDPAPSAETRGQLASAINAFNARSVPLDSKRFALLLHDEAGQLVAGLSASMSWTWLFVDGLWVADARRGQGIGRALLARAEAHARAHGCHAAWLDTFQARGFYEKLGYAAFAELENYPHGQSRTFLRKELRNTNPA
jgi:GNAT superfamily N-acetyltransferase